MSKPVAVLISDIHFNINTLPEATEALQSAILKAHDLKVPLVVAGDLLDQKSIIRAECANKLLSILSANMCETYILVGNHDILNERGKEHSLNFLGNHAHIVDSPQYVESIDSWLLPYYSESKELKDNLKSIPEGSRIIMHQGLLSANMGHYIQDKSALNPEDVKDFRVISGHYHKRQDIKCGHPRKGAVGLFSYIGNPYTLGFNEAKDPSKGYQVLQNNGVLIHTELPLRKHIKICLELNDLSIDKNLIKANDIIWVDLIGTREQLALVDKNTLGLELFGSNNYKLNLLPSNTTKHNISVSSEKEEETLDKLINSLDESENTKEQLKKEWRDLIK